MEAIPERNKKKDITIFTTSTRDFQIWKRRKTASLDFGWKRQGHPSGGGRVPNRSQTKTVGVLVEREALARRYCSQPRVTP